MGNVPELPADTHAILLSMKTTPTRSTQPVLPLVSQNAEHR